MYKFIAEVFIYKTGKYFYIDYLLLNEDESESKSFSYKAIKYKTLKAQLDLLLKDYILI